MGIFSDFALKYHEAGYSVMPVSGKSMPVQGKFQEFSSTLPSDDLMNSFIDKHPDKNIAVILGMNGLVCIDIDYDGEEREVFLSGIKEICPAIQVAKKGKKGLSIFYRSKMAGKKCKNPKEKTKTVVEVLSVGNYTIVPPSIHPDTSKEYCWETQDSLLDVSIDDLSVFEESHWIKIKSFVDYFFENNKNSNAGRNNYLGSYAIRVCDDCKSIEELVSKVMKKDIEVFKNNSYYLDPKENKGKHHLEFAMAHVKRAVKFVKEKRKENGIEWDLGRVDNELSKDYLYKDYEDVFLKRFPNADRCLLSGAFVANPYSANIYDDKTVNNKIQLLKSDVILAGLKPTMVEPFLARWEDSFTPKVLLKDVDKWDGFDYLGMLFNHVKFDKIPQELCVEIMKEWCARIWSRVDDSINQNFCPILLGAQGIGKDTFLNKIFRGFRKYYSPVVFSNDEKANFETAKNLLIFNISEFDTTGKINIAALKNLITANAASYRTAYDRDSDSKVLRTSFISSANFEDILVDTSGNRRFAPLYVKEIDFAYSDFLNDNSLKQIVAQSYALNKSGYKASELAWSLVKEQTNLLSPEKTEDRDARILDIYCERIKAISAKYSTVRLLYGNVMLVIHGLCKDFNLTEKKLLGLIKRKGYSRKIDDKYFYSYEPAFLMNRLSDGSEKKELEAIKDYAKLSIIDGFNR